MSTATPETNPGRTVSRPRTATASIWLFISTGLSCLLVAAIGIATVLSPTAIAGLPTTVRGTSLPVSALLPIAAGIVGTFGVIQAGVWILFASFLRQGRGWSRWILAPLAGLGMLGATDVNGLGALPAALGVAASVLMFLPPVNAWLRRKREQRGQQPTH
jgi:hypothetical protein